MVNSVHLQDFPDSNNIAFDAQLVNAMDKVREICNTGLSIRNEENVRIRQPMASITVYGENANSLANFSDIIKDELNVKEVKFEENISEVASLDLKLNFPILGKRLGAKMKEIAGAAKQGNWKDAGTGLVEVNGEKLEPAEFSLTLNSNIEKGASGLPSNDMLVAFDLELTAELINEGIARDLIRAIQQARKDSGFEVSNHINISLWASDKIKEAVNDNLTYLKEQVLAENIDFTTPKNPTELTINDENVSFELAVVS